MATFVKRQGLDGRRVWQARIRITPIVSSLFERITVNNGYVIRSAPRLVGLPTNHFAGSRFMTMFLARRLALILRGNRWGNCNIFVLRPS